MSEFVLRRTPAELLVSDRKRKAKVRNEKLKLAVGVVNSFGLALIIAAMIFPFVRLNDFSVLGEPITWAWVILGVILHFVARWFLDFMEAED